ncbi:rRNA methyltransferase 1, mitochondrial-like [Rhopilema esculentum]|uniref:rRNA methyltransferase 1, mitochondrial-like n=1 Tax=Rhopilema esculentum TaxID=499914 RepID=UPI0031D05E2F|eukprot:gene15368-6600_t
MVKEHIFGIFPCLGALQANKRKIYKLITKDAFLKKSILSKSDKIAFMIDVAKERDLKVDFKEKAYIDKLVGSRPHQNIVMQVSHLTHEKLDINKMKNTSNEWMEDKHFQKQLWIALDQVQDPMNFGAVLRSAAYFGVEGIIATAKNSCRLSPTVSKASAGAMEWMKIHSSENLSANLKELACNGWDVIGTTMPCKEYTDSSDVMPCAQLVLEKPTVLVLGNEGYGVSGDVIDACTKLTTIDSTASINDMDSLNVAVAAGILINRLMTNDQNAFIKGR